jgi:hypothetical protein
MKQARKIVGFVVPSSPTVTLGFVDVGLIWKMLFVVAISETGMEALEQTSPMMNLTPSWSITLLAAKYYIEILSKCF